MSGHFTGWRSTRAIVGPPTARYPTNTPGWWGGAHPFAMLDYSVVHNGEISSYDANRRYIEMFGYKCTLLTDTEVITYIIDYLRAQAKAHFAGNGAVHCGPVLAGDLSEMPPQRTRARYTYLRNAFSPLADHRTFFHPVGLCRRHDGPGRPAEAAFSMVVAEKGDRVPIASERGTCHPGGGAAARPRLGAGGRPAGDCST